MSGRFVILTGSPGAGKTTLAESLATLGRYRIANIGSLMLEEGKRLGYTKDRDRIRYLKRSELDAMRVYAFKKLNTYSGDIIVDTHDYVEENGRFVPGLPLGMIKRLDGIEAFIYVNAEESDIVKRRKKDLTRKRELESIENMKVQKILNLSILSYYSSLLDVPLYLIDNKEGKLNESKARLREVIKEIFSRE